MDTERAETIGPHARQGAEPGGGWGVCATHVTPED